MVSSRYVVCALRHAEGREGGSGGSGCCIHIPASTDVRSLVNKIKPAHS